MRGLQTREEGSDLVSEGQRAVPAGFPSDVRLQRVHLHRRGVEFLAHKGQQLPAAARALCMWKQDVIKKETQRLKSGKVHRRFILGTERIKARLVLIISRLLTSATVFLSGRNITNGCALNDGDTGCSFVGDHSVG